MKDVDRRYLVDAYHHSCIGFVHPYRITGGNFRLIEAAVFRSSAPIALAVSPATVR